MCPKILLAVAAGGAFGAVARYLVYLATARLVGTGFPLATLIVNILGSFAMGVLIEGSALRWNISNELRSLLAVGVLGAFTTFSTFSLDAVALWERGRELAAFVYVSASVILCIAALFAGSARGPPSARLRTSLRGRVDPRRTLVSAARSSPSLPSTASMARA